jgi:hypothetical protein
MPMVPPPRPFSAASLLVACVVLAMAPAIDACGSPDCTETATCPQASDATAPDEPGVADDGPAEASSDASEGGDANDGSPLDTNPPTGPTDGAELLDAADSGDGGTPDAGAADGSTLLDAGDGSSDGGGSQDATPTCNDAAPENCIDGVDNNCNGKIDCADQPACAAYGCASLPPSSWLGPAVLWTGPRTATVPACPAGYSTAVDGLSGLTFANDTCTCQCNATGQTCSGGTALIYSTMDCGGACATLALASGTCTTFSCAGEEGAWQVTAPVTTTGQCTPVVTPTSGGPPTWQTAVRVCSSTGTTNRAGGCSTATDECLPVPASPFAGLCVYQTGTQTTCPAPYNRNAKPFVYSTGSTDGRNCGACTCGGTPTAGTCSGGVHLYGTANCTGTAVASGSGCQQFNNPFGASAQAVEANYSSTPGTCPTPSVLPQPTGAVTATGAFSVCCM